MDQVAVGQAGAQGALGSRSTLRPVLTGCATGVRLVLLDARRLLPRYHNWKARSGRLVGCSLLSRVACNRDVTLMTAVQRPPDVARQHGVHVSAAALLGRRALLRSGWTSAGLATVRKLSCAPRERPNSPLFTCLHACEYSTWDLFVTEIDVDHDAGGDQAAVLAEALERAEQECKAYILDIDLDYFSTWNPFRQGVYPHVRLLSVQSSPCPARSLAHHSF